MSSLLRSTRLIDNCTPSIAYDRQVQSASVAFDNQMFEIIDETGQVIMIPNIMGLTDETLVDILAWQFHVDFYDATKDIDFKKNLVQQSIIWHKTKGTVALVEEVINTYFPGGATLEEWFQYKSPLPPNFPNVDATEWAADFSPADVDASLNRIGAVRGTLAEGMKITFKLGETGNTLPAPLVVGTTYYVKNWEPEGALQVSSTLGGAAIDLTTAGTGTHNEIWNNAVGTGNWHDRYRFRVLIDENIISDPELENQMVELINRYKPVSRWLEAVIRPRTSTCNIGWAGMTLRFIYRESAAPTNYP